MCRVGSAWLRSLLIPDEPLGSRRVLQWELSTRVQRETLSHVKLWQSAAKDRASCAFVLAEPANALRGDRAWSDSERREPPLLAKSLLCIFARTKDIDALMGDFEEQFARDCKSGMSDRRAAARYWAQVLRSIGPQMWQAIKRVGLLGLIAAALRR